MTPAGFSHSDIPGSVLACSSPRLIAACHVLHRRFVPRHPPCALIRLTEAPPAPAEARAGFPSSPPKVAPYNRHPWRAWPSLDGPAQGILHTSLTQKLSLPRGLPGAGSADVKQGFRRIRGGTKKTSRAISDGQRARRAVRPAPVRPSSPLPRRLGPQRQVATRYYWRSVDPNACPRSLRP